ncbi:MAG: A/G-specific adenine glycosylase [Fimbriimonadaceae bacterium]|jgi:A/G-specific adenine glycosylase|nr:A/G-specific adenine glycosylase [Fimbriimonadaceae bacterium]
MRALLNWYDAKKRDLPWRRTNDPYAIWVSEIMLQQTQVATVLPYYARWMERFPTAESLSQADDQDTLSYWQGLGYYRRCRLLLAGVRHVRKHGMPSTEADWRKVPGVGRYTAGALASIANGQPAPVVDGNVERVFARYTGSELSDKELTSACWKWAADVLHQDRPGDWNQALMELGATICKPAKPDCEKCPLRDACIAKRDGLQASLPKPKQRPIVVRLEESVWIPYHQGRFGLRQIPEGRWWHGMWEFPKDLEGLAGGETQHAGLVKYQVTNHRIHMNAYLHRSAVPTSSLKWADEKELAKLPIPAPQRRALALAKARLAAPSLFIE